MTGVVAFPSGQGGTVLVEVHDLDESASRVARGDIPAETTRRFDDVLEIVRPIASAVLSKIEGLGRAPDSVEVEFGIALSFRLGAVLASSGADAHLRVSIKWSNVGEGGTWA
jgi:Trypsin-co-occurring domain 1